MTTAIENLFLKTERAYEESDIKKYAIQNHKTEWYYSLSSTRLVEHGTLIVGFNWGVDQKGDHGKQSKIPDEKFLDLTDLGSFKRVIPFLKKYLPQVELDNIIQTNFCFFRSEKEAQISEKDLASSEVLFKELLEIIKPKRIMGFSNKLRSYFLSHSDLFKEQERKEIPSNKGTLITIKGDFLHNGKAIPVLLLPHPNYPVDGEARKAAWEYWFGNK